MVFTTVSPDWDFMMTSGEPFACSDYGTLLTGEKNNAKNVVMKNEYIEDGPGVVVELEHPQ